jgi:hypothetical protein
LLSSAGDRYRASAATRVIYVSTILGLLRRSVSHNVSRETRVWQFGAIIIECRHSYVAEQRPTIAFARGESRAGVPATSRSRHHRALSLRMPAVVAELARGSKALMYKDSASVDGLPD